MSHVKPRTAIAPSRDPYAGMTEDEIDEIEDEMAAQEALRRMNDPTDELIPSEQALRELGL